MSHPNIDKIGVIDQLSSSRNTVTITGLMPNTTYKFSITAYNGDTVAVNKRGTITSVTNVSVKTKAYAAPIGIRKSVTASSVTLTWKNSPFSETSHYEVWDAMSGTLLATVSASGTTGTVSWTYNNDGLGLSPSTIYKFEIRAASDTLCAISSAPGIGKSLKPAKVSVKTAKYTVRH
jgi:hypothetical protein